MLTLGCVVCSQPFPPKLSGASGVALQGPVCSEIELKEVVEEVIWKEAETVAVFP